MGDIKEKVNSLIKKYKTNNPFEIANMCNINVIYEPLGKMLGFYNTHKRIRFIHINNAIEERLQRFVCAHELGHAILHPKANTPFLRSYTYFSIDKIEVEANTFAVELLMPDEVINEYQDTFTTIHEVAAIYDVPNEVVHLKSY